MHYLPQMSALLRHLRHRPCHLLPLTNVYLCVATEWETEVPGSCLKTKSRVAMASLSFESPLILENQAVKHQLLRPPPVSMKRHHRTRRMKARTAQMMILHLKNLVLETTQIPYTSKLLRSALYFSCRYGYSSNLKQRKTVAEAMIGFILEVALISSFCTR